MVLSEILSLEMRILHLQQQSLPVPDIREMMVVKLEVAIQHSVRKCVEKQTPTLQKDQIWTTTQLPIKKGLLWLYLSTL